MPRSRPDGMKLLALGDSYTIGEGVHPSARWPSLLAGQLKRQGRAIDRITYLARTGWTTDELLAGLQKTSLPTDHVAVFLSIGVNNQYRGLSLEQYSNEFAQLIKQAIQYAGEDTSRVFVLSIPDWGTSPFAADRDRDAIARHIDSFNEANAKITRENACVYTDITQLSRAQSDPKYYAADNLHPSKLAYTEWANTLLPLVRKALE